MEERDVADLLIRDLPADVHARLKQRAADAGMSLQAYLSRELTLVAGRPTLADWLAGLDDLTRHPGLSGADAVADARERPA